MHIRFNTLLLLLLCCWRNNLCAQQSIIDSLEHELFTAKDDTSRINLHFYLADQLFGYDSIKPLQHLQDGLALAKKIDDNYQIAVYYYWRGSFLARTLRAAESLPYLDTAVIFFDKHAAKFEGDSKIQEYVRLTKSNLFSERATAYSALYQYENAVNSYLASIAEWQKSAPSYPKRDESIGIIYGNIATLYRQIGETKNALKYCRLALPHRLKDGNKDYLARIYMEFALNYTSLNDFDSAKLFLAKSQPLVTEVNQPLLNINYYLRQGEYYRLTKNYRSAVVSFESAKQNALQINHKFHLAGSLNGMAESHLGENDVGMARDEALAALVISEQLGNTKSKLKSISILAEAEEKAGNTTKAFAYLKQRLVLKDTLEKENVRKMVMELDARYQSGLKDAKILKISSEKDVQESEVQRRSIINYLLASGLAAILIISILGYRNFRNRQELSMQNYLLQNQRIKELELEKQLIASNSLLKGQELERSRMAKDLHDGLGGILSGVKLSLGAMKGNVILTEENSRLFNRVLDQLDVSISEMRRVAHNMMPEALVRLGLEQAIRDYCDGLSADNRLDFKIQFHGLEQRLDEATEIVVFRIVQELLNNVVKHADATTVIVQIMRHDDSLTITIEDNGKGFNTSNASHGAGLGNVRSRVDLLKGQIDLQSESGKGTSVHIEFTILDS